MEAIDLPLIWRRNAPDAECFTLYNEDSVDPVPFDLTGFSFMMEIRDYPGAAGDPIFTFGMANEGEQGFFINSAIDGEFTLTPPTRADLLALATSPTNLAMEANLAYDIILIHPDGVYESFISGVVSLKTGVTVTA